MSDHDPLCSINLPQGVCRCPFLAAVRADEREKIAHAIEAELVGYADEEGWVAHKAYEHAARIARQRGQR